jgi:hypothetical protein
MANINPVIKIKDFRVLFLARLLVIGALVSQDVIIGWQVYSITHDVFMLD